ncbi:MAG: outer membrane beta-barrel protein [Cyclobacteriaceae bacterium]|nr:outer membrane beta-barrel protein [Cyclobacteriaceae bacterium]
MLRYLIGTALFCIVTTAFAQRSELGFGIGTFNYTGDLVRNYNFTYSRPAATVIYRSNINRIVSFRASVTGGKIEASEKPIDVFAAQRNASFDIFLLEGSMGIEYHFLNWKDGKVPMRFTPYLFGGLALFGISGNDTKPAEYSNVQMSVPFGGGFKYIVNPRWYVALEFGVRKTFFDYLDNVSDFKDQAQKNYRYGNPNDTDTYYFLGITLTRTFYDIPCPTNPYK